MCVCHVEIKRYLLTYLFLNHDYRVRQIKTPQHETRNFSEMHEYFYTKFCWFVQHITVHESVDSCYISQRVDVRRNDGNFNLKNEFFNWTNVDILLK